MNNNLIVKKFFIALLFVLSLSFASWQELAMLSIFASIGILALIYAVGYGFGLEQAKFLAKDEMYQLIVTAVLVAILISTDSYFQSVSTNLGDVYSGQSQSNSMQFLALESLNNTINNESLALNKTRAFASSVGHFATESYYCNLLGSGMFVSTCGAYGTLLPPLSIISQLLSTAMAELSSLYLLVSVGLGYSFNFLLPVGLFMRTFKITRGAGGLLISFAISLYFVVPISILVINSVIEDYSIDNGMSISSISLNVDSCKDKEVTINNRNKVVSALDEFVVEVENNNVPTSPDQVERFTFFFLISSTFLTVITILIFLLSLRSLTSVMGAEVDVSALGKLA